MQVNEAIKPKVEMTEGGKAKEEMSGTQEPRAKLLIFHCRRSLQSVS